ncbi:alpha/beta fold hydrolase [Streptomyces sp. NPDC059897]|uniref:alpha/beta hydrolase n=1 Tax=Streptomyces sp. NPDC059897 TaxID=3346994 RepID=UPI003661EF0C
MAPERAFFEAYDKVMAKWPESTAHLDVPTPYGSTHVHALGPADAPPLLLLPGGGASSAGWYANVAALAQSRRVYAPDLIGEPGRSVAAPGRPVRTVADLSGWLDALLAGLDVTAPVDLCGHSYGAWIALHCALRDPGRVGALTLLDPTRCYAGLRAGYLAHALPTLLRPAPHRTRRFLVWEAGGAALDGDWLALQEAAAGFPSARPVTGRIPERGALRTLGETVRVRVVLAGESRAHGVRRVAERAGPGTVTVPGLSHHAMPLQLGAGLAELVA